MGPIQEAETDTPLGSFYGAFFEIIVDFFDKILSNDLLLQHTHTFGNNLNGSPKRCLVIQLKMQVAPSSALRHLVRHYLVLESESTNSQTYRFFPDGSPGLVLSYADPVTAASTAINWQHLFAYGLTDQYYDLKAGQRIGLLVVVFWPWAFYALSGLAGEQTINLRFRADDFFGSSIRQLQNELADQSTTTERIRRIETFLLQRQLIANHRIMIVRQVVQAIQQTGGTGSVQQLSSQSATTERSLERYFNEAIGMPPKQLSRIIRLQNCLKIYRRESVGSTAQLACSAGYYDQAHFIRECIQLAGLTPKQYSANPARLAANLVSLAS